MDFRELSEKVVRNALAYGEKYDVRIDKEFAALKLFEEAGEFAQALLVYDKKSRPEKFMSEEKSRQDLAEELADVIGMAIVAAHVLDIDITEALDKKWIDKDED